MISLSIKKFATMNTNTLLHNTIHSPSDRRKCVDVHFIFSDIVIDAIKHDLSKHYSHSMKSVKGIVDYAFGDTNDTTINVCLTVTHCLSGTVTTPPLIPATKPCWWSYIFIFLAWRSRDKTPFFMGFPASKVKMD